MGKNKMFDYISQKLNNKQTILNKEQLQYEYLKALIEKYWKK